VKAFLDTHAAVALYEGRSKVFGTASTRLLESSALLISPVVALELEFLFEIQRLTAPSEEIVERLASEIGVVTSNDSIAQVIRLAMPLRWTRDPFDRMLVATAELHRSPLITRDRKIRQHYGNAVW